MGFYWEEVNADAKSIYHFFGYVPLSLMTFSSLWAVNTFSPIRYACFGFNRFLTTPLLICFVAPAVFPLIGGWCIALRNTSIWRENRIDPEAASVDLWDFWWGLFMTGLLIYRTTQDLLFPINNFHFSPTLCFPHPVFSPTNPSIRKRRFHNHPSVCGLPEKAGVRLSSCTAPHAALGKVLGLSCSVWKHRQFIAFLCFSSLLLQSFPSITAWRCNTKHAASTPWLMVRKAPLWSCRRTYNFVFTVLSSSEPQVLTSRAVGQITAPPPTTTLSAVPMDRISRDSLNSLNSRFSHTWLSLTEMDKGASSKWLCWQLQGW